MHTPHVQARPNGCITITRHALYLKCGEAHATSHLLGAAHNLKGRIGVFRLGPTAVSD